MKKFNRTIFLACGLLLTLAAASVFAQQNKERIENQPQEREVRANKKPFEDFAQDVADKVKRKEIDLTKPFSVELTGEITKGGKLDPKTAKFTKSEGDEAMSEVGKSFLGAVNDSGLFYYLKQNGVEKIKFVVGQDETRAYGVITSEIQTAEKAKTIASGVRLLLSLAEVSLRNRQNNEDEKILINGASVGSADKTLTLKMDYEKSVIQEMINRKLKEAQAKQQQSNGE